MSDSPEPFDPAEALAKLGIDAPEVIPPEEIFVDDVNREEHVYDLRTDQVQAIGTFYQEADEQPKGTAAGVKLDQGKLPIWKGVITYFGPALKAVAAISEFGSRKYTWGGWRTVENGEERYTEALFRHTFDEAAGEDYDPETGMLHAAHAAWNALARLVLILARKPLRKPD